MNLSQRRSTSANAQEQGISEKPVIQLPGKHRVLTDHKTIVMQNLDTLIELGFQRNFHGELFWRGTQKVFVAKIVDYNGPYPFVDLYEVSNQIDDRPDSDRKGRHYQSFLKICASEGSVARALIKYDLPSDKKENQLI